MSLTDRISSLNGEMHRQQLEVLQQYCRDLEGEVAYYRNRLKYECSKREQAQASLSEDWYFVKKELYNFITFTRAITPAQAMESPLLKNIVHFDRKMTEFQSISEMGDIDNMKKDHIQDRPSSGFSYPKRIVEADPESSDDVGEDALQKILNLW
jgi:hypothetical protein